MPHARGVNVDRPIGKNGFLVVATERLKLREFSKADLDELAAMVADEDQMRFYFRTKTRDEASAWITRNLGLYERYGFGSWLIESITGSGFLGYCGIRPLVLDGASEIEIGWHIRKMFWGQGIATEAATAAQDLAVRRFRLSRVVAIIHPDHIASRRVAEKIGMEEERTTSLEDYDDYPAVVYTTERP
jgi:RimJ/RimL family protein N-acetyltransferase